ncbi:hypothetical protein GCM10007860_26050 [Chitiniphilus shinanonensis]|uniref:DUF3302 domain-containing protein n=1 Tax=Chitiniphilus shinanonensis TaxID=553088 RepID=A0ABQ6BYZ3_9NEIS|nr:DUF3302 domain-containing protein [Chitiniphilus shinanonensis]GLS05452.1 hypothetical protein GCM10007860_26050 [Chitiniphilus shinanonensis]
MARLRLAGGFVPLTLSIAAHASLFKGEALDTAANVLSWIVLIVLPIAGIAIFWMLHILPEKIAHQRHHPQKDAIHTLCMLSLFFGGLLWPLAWLWAYTKPVLYKMAYGIDKVIEEHDKKIGQDEAHLAQLDQQVNHDEALLHTMRAEIEALKAELNAVRNQKDQA